ncbi:hypothetical protein YC2023_010364 [Brassica napus]
MVVGVLGAVLVFFGIAGEMAGLFERKKHKETSSLIEAHVLWSGWPVQSGNKVMQQRRRSKMPNSWMFKYKEKLHLLSLASG